MSTSEATKRVTRLTITTLAAGQPRAYADSRYEYEIDVEWNKTFGPNPDEVIRATGDTLERKAEWAAIGQYAAPCKTRYHKKKNAVEWHESYVDEVRVLGPGKAFVRIVQPYCD